MTRARKPRKPTIQEAFNALPLHSVVTLSIDTARKSGWAITLRGTLADSGECDVYSGEPARVARLALDLAKTYGIPCVLVCEKPFKAGTGTSAGMGAAFGAWMAAWCAAGGVKSRWRKVLPAVWRSRVLGKGWGNAGREAVQAEEQRVALAIKSLLDVPDVGVEEAPAILIGVWSSRAPEILKVLPKSFATKTQQSVTA